MLRDLVVKNRSYRGFDETRRLTREELLELVDMTRYVASGVNLQPLKYYIAWEKETVDTIQPLTNWAKALTNMTLPHPGKCPTAFIVICHDKSIAPNEESSLTELGAVAQTILLGAVEKGLGGCMIGNFNPAVMKETLNLADSLQPKLVLGIGKPDEEIRIVPVGPDGSTSYYRDEHDVHYVPKRELNDIII